MGRQTEHERQRKEDTFLTHNGAKNSFGGAFKFIKKFLEKV
jgi:hypothetical protein